jgi:hypothetical protein
MTQPQTIPPLNGTTAPAPPSLAPAQAQDEPPEPVVFVAFALSGVWQLGQLFPARAEDGKPSNDPFRIVRMFVRENGDLDVYGKSEGDNDYARQSTSAIVTLYARTIERVVTMARNDVWLDMLREEDEDEEEEPETPAAPGGTP